VQALVFAGWGLKPELREVPEPEPGPGEVRIRVAGSGVCHSDLHLFDWAAGELPFDPPFVLGHENAGWVDALGPGVAGFDPGDSVAVYGPCGCGRCWTCSQGMENYCERAHELKSSGPGIGADGGMAEYLVVPARLLVPIGDLDPVEAAPLTDAGLTPYHAIKRSLPALVPGTTVVLIGIGGLGHMAVQCLRALAPSQIVAVDPDAAKRRLALESGADLALDPGDEAAARLRSATKGQGAELIIDMVGSDATLTLAATMARARGEITVVGLGMGRIAFNFFAFPYECSIATTFWGTTPELMEVIALAQAGKLRAEIERFPLSESVEAYRRLREGAIHGRAVIIP
jgi:propanol-preferring alcohol dehydrogenase